MKPIAHAMPEDLPELDDLLDAAGGEQPMTPRQLREWNANVHSRIEDDLDSLLSEAARPKQQWITVAAVVLIHETRCLCCQQTSRHSQGWYTAQKHTSDKFANRLTAGKPIGHGLPMRVEHHQLPDVEICANCAESQILIEQSTTCHTH
jgi:hypothetical protein